MRLDARDLALEFVDAFGKFMLRNWPEILLGYFDRRLILLGMKSSCPCEKLMARLEPSVVNQNFTKTEDIRLQARGRSDVESE